MSEPYSILCHHREYKVAPWPGVPSIPQCTVSVMIYIHHPFMENPRKLVVERLWLRHRESMDLRNCPRSEQG